MVTTITTNGIQRVNGGKEMLKKILLASIFVITAITGVTYAEDDMKTVASKAYVDTKIETKQLKIPAANTPGVGAGETVMTYTSTGNGQIGERGLYSDISSYDATTDGDKLITASALNATFTNLPTTDTTKLECANQNDGCTLWTIVDQTAYGISGDGTTTIDLSALVNVKGTGACAKRLDGSSDYTDGVGCDTPLTNFADWGVTFPYNDGTVQVNGISACSAVTEGLSSGGIPTNQSGVQADYESNMASAPTNNPVGEICYCKLSNPAASPWVFSHSYSSASDCAFLCAADCALGVRISARFRGAVFGSVAQ